MYNLTHGCPIVPVLFAQDHIFCAEFCLHLGQISTATTTPTKWENRKTYTLFSLREWLRKLAKKRVRIDFQELWNLKGDLQQPRGPLQLMKAPAPQPESTVTFLPVILSAGCEVGSYAPSEVNRNLPARVLFVSPVCPWRINSRVSLCFDCPTGLEVNFKEIRDHEEPIRFFSIQWRWEREGFKGLQGNSAPRLE